MKVINTIFSVSASDNLKGLLGLRLASIVGQIIAIILATSYLDMSIPLIPVLGVIAASVMFNFLSLLLLKYPQRINDNTILFQLLFDVFQLTATLYFIGGATNAFAWFLLVPHTVASTLLSKTYAWLMGVSTALSYTFIMFFYRPIMHMGHEMEIPEGGHFQEHVFGMWIGFVLATFLIAYFIAGMAETLRRRNEMLTDLREEALRDERLIALGTLATGAAHELGTPLATMDILAHDLEISFDELNDIELTQKLVLIQEQIKRCKNTLSSITRNYSLDAAEEGQVVPIDVCISHIIKQWRISHLGVRLKEQYNGGQPAPAFISTAAFSHALINVLDNAAQASPDIVNILVSWNEQLIVITVIDEGDGMGKEILESLGSPVKSSKESGLGIGLSLTKASIERMGGSIRWENSDRGGVAVSIEFATGLGRIT